MLFMAHTALKAIEHVSTTKIAATGGAGSVVAIAAATIEPGMVEFWLRITTLGVGLLTGLGSGGLVLLRYLDRWKGKKDSTFP